MSGRFGKFRRELLVGAGVFLISTLSFALGYLTNREASHAPIVIEQCQEGDML